MAKFYGKIGYAVRMEIRPGVWDDEITEREYFGDLLRNTSRYQTSDKLNDDVNISNEISIVADPLPIRIFMQCGMSSLWELNGKFPVSKFSIRV